MKYNWKINFQNIYMIMIWKQDEPDNAKCILEFSVSCHLCYITPYYYPVMQHTVVCTREDTISEVKSRYFCLSVTKVVIYTSDGHFGDFYHHLNNKRCET
jgi:hypothetical protein